jgi:hypothetical protein
MPVPAAELTGSILDYAGDAEWVRQQADPKAKGYKDGRPADFERGVQWIGPWEDQADGFNEHTRRSVHAFASSGIPVQLRGLNPRLDVEEEALDLVRDVAGTSIAKYEVRVVQCVPGVGVIAKWVTHQHLDAEAAAGRNAATILYTVWERENIDPGIVRKMSLAGGLWVGCKRSAKALVAAGADPRRVAVVPVPHWPDDPMLALSKRKRVAGAPRFLHIGKWEPRKTQDKILHGFMRAFRPGEAELIVKTSKSNPRFTTYPNGPVEAVSVALGDEAVRANGWTETNISPSIRMIRERLTDKQMVGLHGWADIYVSVAHGEGFDMPAYDSALAGNRIVYTPSGGPEDYTGEHDVMVEGCGIEPVDPFYDWEESATWASVTLDGVVSALKKAANLPLACIERDMSAFSAAEVGKRMAELVEAQAATFGVTFEKKA